MELNTNLEKETLDFWKYEKEEVPKTAIARQKWDMIAIETKDSDRITWALQNYFEPFGITTAPRPTPLAGQVEIVTTIWFKRPAHKNEEIDGQQNEI
jgi:hypothetical protein